LLKQTIRTVATAAVTAAALISPGTAAMATTPTTPYVALGDSYAAGVGAPPYLDPTCLRSTNGYPALLAAERKVTDFRSNACSGAVTADVIAGQLDGLDGRTKLVTITIGGNDLGFSTSIGTCMQGSDADCEAVSKAFQQGAVQTLPARLDAVYAAVKQRAPRATVITTGYAHFFETSVDCDAVPMVSLPKRTALNAAVDTLNRSIARQASRAKSRFADVLPVFAGHGLCSDDPWITGPTDTAPFHPNAAGYREGYLPVVRKSLTCI